jgi:hypothetical protein
LEHLENLWSVEPLDVNSGGLLFSEVLEVRNITSSFLLDLSDFLKFVEVEEEVLTIKGLLLTSLLGN